MPAGLAGPVLHRPRVRGGDVAAVGSLPPGGPPMATWNTYIAVADADETAREGPRTRARSYADGALRRHGRRAHGRVLPTPRAPCSSSGRQRTLIGATVVNEPGSLKLNGLATRDPAAAKAVLRLGVRLDDDRRGRRRGDVDAARATATTSSATTRACASMIAQTGGPGRLRGRRRQHQPDRRRPAATRRRTGASPSGSRTPTPRPRRPRELGGDGRRRAASTLPWVADDRCSATRRARSFIASQFVPGNKALGGEADTGTSDA